MASGYSQGVNVAQIWLWFLRKLPLPAPTWVALSLLLGAAFVASNARAEVGDDDKIHIYYSPTTEQHYKSLGVGYSHVVRRWPDVLDRYGKQVQQLTRDQLVTNRAKGGGVLILPSTIALDAQERGAIERFVAQGGSLLGTGMVGYFDGSGKSVGPAFLERVFRVKTHGFFPDSDDSFFMPFGDGPLTWPIPAMRRMGIGNPRDNTLRISAKHEAGVIMDWSRTMDLQPHAAMAYDEVGKSRIAYISLPDHHWGKWPDARLVFDATLGWLLRQPHAYKAAWPHGHVAGHLIEMDTEDKYFSAPNFANHLESEGFRGTFYSLTSEAVRVPEVVRDLIKRGHEIAYHADVHFGFKGDPVAEQELRILFMKKQMEGILGDRAKEATGFRAPTESYDRNTEILLRKHGILHHAADESANEDRLPFFSPSEPGLPPSVALVNLPRTQKDDINFTRMRLNVAQAQEILFYDLELAVKSGSFSLLSVHSQFYTEGALMHRAMPEYMKRVGGHKSQLWVARGDEITLWWRRRAAVRVEEVWRAGQLNVDLNNASGAAVEGLSVHVSLPARGTTVRVRTKPADIKTRIKPIDAFRAAIVFERLPPGASSVALSFH